MKHVIVFLFDSVRLGGKQTEFIENYLKNLDPPQIDLDVFYFKMNTVDPGKNHVFIDELQQVVFSGKGNTLEPVGGDYNFREGTELKRAFITIKEKITCAAQYYYFGAGHGSGFYNFPRYLVADILKNKEKALPSTDNNAIEDFVRAFSFREDIWEKEVIWNVELADALTELNPAIAVFNNCNVNFFDSLYFYSPAFRYVVATENYVNIAMLNLPELIQVIIDRGGRENTETLARSIFEVSKTGFHNGGNGVPGMKHASLFLLDLKTVPSLLKGFNEICRIIEEGHTAEVKWYRDLSSTIQPNYLSRPNRLIDMLVMLKGIGGLLKDDALSSCIKQFEADVGNAIIAEPEFIGEDPGNLFGMTIYLPIINKEAFHIEKFADYFAKYSERLNVFNWYRLLDTIKAKIPEP